jgi:O-antigen ligase
MGLLLVILVLRFPGSPAPIYGATKILGFMAYSVFPVALIFTAFRSNRDGERILDAVLIVGASWLLLSLWIAVSHGSLDLYRADPGELLGGTSQSGGGVGGRAVPVALIALASASRSGRWRAARIGVGLVGIIVLVLSGHRGSIGAFLVGALVLIAFNFRRIHVRQVLSGLLAFTALVVIGWWTLQHAPAEVQARYEDPFASQSVADRVALQRLALSGWLESPVVGNGTGSSAFLATSSDQASFGVVSGIYPHNVSVELLAEVGLLGAATYLVTIGGTMLRAVRARRGSPRDEWAIIAAGSCVSAAFVASQTGADLTIQNDLWIFLGILALAAAPVGRAWRDRYAERFGRELPPDH